MITSTRKGHDVDFTNAEKERINILYGNDFKDITPDDALLIGRWEAAKAVREEEHQAKIEAMLTETKAKVAATNEHAAQAMSNLKELHAKALERLERIENGQ